MYSSQPETAIVWLTSDYANMLKLPPSFPGREFSLSRLRRGLKPDHFLPILTAGLISGLLLITYALSFAAVIFSGSLELYLPLGMRLVLFSAVVLMSVIAFRTSVPGILANPQESAVALLALLASSLAAAVPPAASETETLSTVVVAIALTTITTGLLCLGFGRLKLGNLTRYIPYPVIGGFLAGTGWLLLQGGVSFMTNQPLTWSTALALWQPDTLIQWLPGLGLALVFLGLVRRYRHPLLLPGLLFGSLAGFYLLALDLSLAQMDQYDLLLGPFPRGQLWQPGSLILQANWPVIGSQLGQIAIISFITVLSFLVKLSGLELEIKQDLELDRELRATGIANILTGLGGGIIGFHGLSLTTLSYDTLGARSRLVGLIAAAISGAVLMFGTSWLAYFPRSILGALVLFLGLNFLWDWLYDIRAKLPRSDYGIILLIFAAVVAVGFLEGVAIGLVVTIILFVINYSRMEVTRYQLPGSHYLSKVERPPHQAKLLRETGDQLEILVLQGFIFFGTANKLLTQVRQRLSATHRQPLKFLLLDFRLVRGLDSSAVLSLNKLKQLAQKQTFSLVLTQLSPIIQKQLQLGGCLDADPALCEIFPDLDRGVEWCEEQLLATVPWRRRRALPLSLQLDEQFTHPDHVGLFMDHLETLDLETGDYLFQSGEAASALYLIESGQVMLVLPLAPGQAKRIQTLGAGNPVGELAFFQQGLHPTAALIDAPSRLYSLSEQSWQQLCQAHPEVANSFQALMINRLSRRLAAAYQEITDLLQ
jgi:SulP family sulfate permease